MKCEDYLPLIESYVDGELEGQSAQRVRTHLSMCDSCQEYLAELRQEQEVYSLYKREVDITPALWDAVQARIESEKPAARPSGFLEGLTKWVGGLMGTPRLSPALAVALIVATVGTTVVVMKFLNSPDNTQVAQTAKTNDPNAPSSEGVKEPMTGNKVPEIASTTQPVPDAPGPTPRRDVEKRVERPKNVVAGSPKPEPTPEQLVREAEQKYLSAIAILEKDVNRNKSKLDPMMVVRFEKAMVEIDNTIAETRRAVRENPDDPIALQYMLSAYAKKIDVLREVARSNQAGGN